MKTTVSSIITKLSTLDKRIIFLFIGLSIIISLVFKLQFKEFPGVMARRVFDKIESLPENSKVLVAMDYDPASAPELHPMSVAFVRQLASRKAKIYFIALYPMGPSMTSKVVESVLRKSFPQYTYGENYMELGYKSGYQGVPNVMLTNIKKLFTAAKMGDELALSIIEQSAKILGAGLSGIVNLLNPEAIIFGGGVIDGGAGYIEIVGAEIRKRSFPTATENLRIVKAELGNNAGFIGAALLGEHKL